MANAKKDGWVARCGFRCRIKTELHNHQATCADCQAAAWRVKPSGEKVTHRTRCGLEFPNYRLREQHLRECVECGHIKRENIRLRMEKLNKDNESPQRRAVFSATAKKTAARPEVQAARAARLEAWRKANPDKLALCTEAACRSPKHSKMEAWLRSKLGWDMSQIRCGEERKQVDFVWDEIWIEVDGHFHFNEPPVLGGRYKPLSYIQLRDAMLNAEAVRRGDVMLIRAAMTCFVGTSGEMKPEWFRLLTDMLASPTPGVWCFGGLYESCPWANGGCTILKSPVLPITSSSLAA